MGVPDRTIFLIGRLAIYLSPVAFGSVIGEGMLALWVYPALRDLLQESWLTLGLKLWSWSFPFVAVLVGVTVGVALFLQQFVDRSRAIFWAASGVLGAMLIALIPVLLRAIFPSRIPWDRSLMVLTVGLACVMPLASLSFGLWARWAARRSPGRVAIVVAAMSVLLAIPGFLYDLEINSSGNEGERFVNSLETPLLEGDSVVLVTVDTLRASHMSLYGYERDTTPRLSAWAKQHTVFTQAITPRTFTAPAVASIMSGLYPGLHGVGRHPDRLPDVIVTLAERFSDHGYRTAAFVTNPALARSVFNFGQGFEDWHSYPEEESRAETVLGDARGFIQRQADSPFFLWLHLLDPHSPYRPPQPFDTKFIDDQFYGQLDGVQIVPADGAWGPREVSLQDALGDDWEDLGIDEQVLWSADYLAAQYDGEIAYLDEQLSVFLDELGRVVPEALVILTSDHGESLVEHEYFFTHGRFCYEPTALVPLVVAHKRFPARRIDEVVSTVDLLPTLVELIGFSSPLVVEGRSLSGALLGTHELSRSRVVRLGARSTNSYPTLCLRSERWKLVLTPRRYSQPLDFLLETQFRFGGSELPTHFFRVYETELYNLPSDAREVRNVADDEHVIRTELQASLWSSIFQQQSHKSQVGASYEPDLPELDEDTLRELRTLGYIR